ncbi:hemoglobin subunit beta-2 [Elysia marginata]|uniref:Globin n=1 Tax=Elysia marginata TaxID=1093978 RepID=A0AAV4J4W6_9GAST|nr:hemoglobin subunit beta-2 [Elysia marginata]
MNLQNKSVAFLIAFFKRYPHHQRYFKMFRDVPPDELKTLPLLENHGRRVMDQMLKLVQNMDDLDLVQEQLAWISMKHKPRQVRSRQFKDMLSMFVEFTGHEMGDKFTAQHEQAWNKWLAYILSILEDEDAKTGVSNGNVKVMTSADHVISTKEGATEVQPKTSSEVEAVAVKEAEPDIMPAAAIVEVNADKKGDNRANNDISNDVKTGWVKENANTNATTDFDRTTTEYVDESDPVSKHVTRDRVGVEEVGLKPTEPVTYSEVSSDGNASVSESHDCVGPSGGSGCSSVNLIMLSSTCASVVNSDDANEATRSDNSVSNTTVLDSPALPAFMGDLRHRTGSDHDHGISCDVFPVLDGRGTEEAGTVSQIVNINKSSTSCSEVKVQGVMQIEKHQRNGTKVSENTESTTTNVEIHNSIEATSKLDGTEVSFTETNKNTDNSNPACEKNVIVRA